MVSNKKLKILNEQFLNLEISELYELKLLINKIINEKKNLNINLSNVDIFSIMGQSRIV